MAWIERRVIADRNRRTPDPHHGVREQVEQGIVDIIRKDTNQFGGITAWKVAAMANFSSISIAAHACEGPIRDAGVAACGRVSHNFQTQECWGQAVPQVRDKVWEEWFGFPAAMQIVNGQVMVKGEYPVAAETGAGVGRRLGYVIRTDR